MADTSPARRDPRDIVTLDAFAVAPELLGRRLASPWRRGAALLVDLGLVFLLTRLNALVFGVVAGLLFFFLVMRGARGHWLRRVGRGILSAAGALALFFSAVILAYRPSAEDVGGNPFAMMTAGQWQSFGQQVASPDPEVRRRAAEGLVADLASRGASDAGLAEVVEAFQLPPEILADLQNLLAGSLEPPATPGAATDPAAVADALDAYAAALRDGDEAAGGELAARVRELIAGREIDRRQEQIKRLQRLARELRGEVVELRDQVEHPSFLRLVKALGADLGLTFGWGGVYFSLFLAGWRGRTPGKRLFRLRVVRLDHRPLTLWVAFERFAGYAAGLATGLLGFVQVFWDANRQGVHDKIVGTVVIDERSAPPAG